jgi:hypothetical protein
MAQSSLSGKSPIGLTMSTATLHSNAIAIISTAAPGGKMDVDLAFSIYSRAMRLVLKIHDALSSTLRGNKVNHGPASPVKPRASG